MNVLTSTISTLSHSFSMTTLRLNFQKEAIEKQLPGSDTATAPFGGIGLLITQVLNIMVTVGVIAVLFYFILGAIDWITAGGDSGKTQKAREKMTNAVVGLIILISAVALMIFVQRLLGICVLNFGNTCGSSTTGPSQPAP